MPPEKLHWKHLYSEVVTSGLCTGCAGCVIACPHDVLGYRDDEGIYRPFQLEDGFAPDNCSHGEKGCTSCTRACPRFRAWEPEIDEFMFGRVRTVEEPSGVCKDIVLARATDPVLAEVGQDGGLVSALLIYTLEHDVIDAALVSYLEGDGTSWKAIPGVARDSGRGDRVGRVALHVFGEHDGVRRRDRGWRGTHRVGGDELSVVGAAGDEATQGRQSGPATVVEHRVVVFQDVRRRDLRRALRSEVRATKSEMKKMNIKGVFQIWMHNGDYHEIPLKECHAWTREGCKMCPDFAAEHADISTGGIGAFNDWTLTIVRTETGRELMDAMLTDGWIETRPGDDDPAAIALMHKLSTRSRKRWPEFAIDAPRRVSSASFPVVTRAGISAR